MQIGALTALANLVFCLGIASSANAGWQYAEWGMKIDQVIAASKGTAQRFNETNSDLSVSQEEGASGSFESGGLKFSVNFISPRVTGGWGLLSWSC